METHHDFESETEVVNYLKERGYELNFGMDREGLKAPGENKPYKPEEVCIDEFFRFEGPSNPDDLSIVYAIKTLDGKKGTCVCAYGPMGDVETTDFFNKVEIHREEKGDDECND